MFGFAVRVHQVALKQGLISSIGTISNGEVARRYIYMYTQTVPTQT